MGGRVRCGAGQERGQLARNALSAGNPGEAYRLASEHGFTRGSELADSEWLAGGAILRSRTKYKPLERRSFVDTVRRMWEELAAK